VTYPLPLSLLSAAVGDLKAAIASQTDVEQERQRLIYSGKAVISSAFLVAHTRLADPCDDLSSATLTGKVLKDEEALSTYKLQSNHTIHMVKGAPKTAPAAAAPASAAFGAPSSAGRGLPTMATGQGAGPLAALEGVQVRSSLGLVRQADGLLARTRPRETRGRADHPSSRILQGHGFGGGTMNPFADMGNLNDPNAMGDMMNNPAFLEQMGQMMQNPEVVDQVSTLLSSRFV
jgi:ubiquilin